MYNNTVKNVRDVFEIPALLSCEFGKEVQEKFNNSKIFLPFFTPILKLTMP